MSDWILVTGASGFVGSHTMGALRDAGWRVRALTGDLRDAASVRAAMQDVDCVVHLGGIASVNAANQAPDHAFQVNTLGTHNVLEAARTSGLSRVVILSTAHVYGPSSSLLPIDESTACAPASVYAATKLAADTLALGYHRSFGLPVTILRAFNIYGPGQRAHAVIPELAAQLAAGLPLRARNLAPKRDFVFVSDVADAVLKCLTSPVSAGRVYVLASGIPVSIAELVRRISAIAGRDDRSPTSEPAGALDCIFGNAARAADELGWRPAIDLQDGLARTVDWWRSI